MLSGVWHLIINVDYNILVGIFLKTLKLLSYNILTAYVASIFFFLFNP